VLLACIVHAPRVSATAGAASTPGWTVTNPAWPASSDVHQPVPGQPYTGGLTRDPAPVGAPDIGDCSATDDSDSPQPILQALYPSSHASVFALLSPLGSGIAQYRVRTRRALRLYLLVSSRLRE